MPPPDPHLQPIPAGHPAADSGELQQRLTELLARYLAASQLSPDEGPLHRREPTVFWPPDYSGARRSGYADGGTLSGYFPPGHYSVVQKQSPTKMLKFTNEHAPDDMSYFLRSRPYTGMAPSLEPDKWFLFGAELELTEVATGGEGAQGRVDKAKGYFTTAAHAATHPEFPFPPTAEEHCLAQTIAVKTQKFFMEESMVVGPHPDVKRERPIPDHVYRGSWFQYPPDFILLSALRHPHIVTLYDYTRAGVTSGGVSRQRRQWYAFMEWADGGDLTGLYERHVHAKQSGLKKSPKDDLRSRILVGLPDPVLRTIALHTMDGLAFAHYHGIVHADLKGDNVLVSRHGDFKLTDYGLGRPVASSSRAGSPDVGIRELIGNVAFLAHEALPFYPGLDMELKALQVLENRSRVLPKNPSLGGRPMDQWWDPVDGAKADVFAMAGVIYYLATSRLLNRSNSECPDKPLDLMQIFKERLTKPHYWFEANHKAKKTAKLPEACVAWLGACMNSQPSERLTARDSLGHKWLIDPLMAFSIAHGQIVWNV